ncbi:MAG TPA: M50 family metallopeptidase [Candidatus Saccharimonadales bacterium]|jgi:regulator of sigma E protease|nr:M50 family metallopeptidase [Candidatus Saccharimonadales bacterium]
MELIFGIIVGVLILVFLVTVHELGHAIIARRNGVVVEEFGIGFPPRAWAKKLKNGVLFTLNWLPLGGFVKLQGEHDAADQKGDYGAATFWQKTRILLAGVLINWLVAALLLTVLAWTGLPKLLPNQFSVANDTTIVKKPVELGLVVKDSPADKAGLKTGDQIVRFAGRSVATSEDLSAATEENKGKTVEIIYARRGVENTTNAVLRTDKKDGYLGVGSQQREQIQATWSAPIVGVVTTGQFTYVTLQSLGDLLVDFTKGVILQFSFDASQREEAGDSLEKAGNSVAGPIGILGTIFPAAERAGLTQLTFLTAIISLTLAVMNALPIPALDGGRWFTMAIFRLLKKPLTKDIEEKIQTAGFMILMGLIIIVTIADVGKLF